MVHNYILSTFPFIRQTGLLRMGLVLWTGYPADFFPIFFPNFDLNFLFILFFYLTVTSPYSGFIGTNSTSMPCPNSLIAEVWVVPGHMLQVSSSSWLLNFFRTIKLMWLLHEQLLLLHGCCAMVPGKEIFLGMRWFPLWNPSCLNNSCTLYSGLCSSAAQSHLKVFFHL